MSKGVYRPTQWQPGGIASLVGMILGSSVVLVGLVQPQVAALVLLALLAPFVLIIIGNAERLLLAVILLEIPIQLDTYLFFRPEADALGSLGGVNLSVTPLCLGLLYALWFAQALARLGGPPRSLWRLSLPPLAYLVATLFSVATAHDRLLASFEVTLLFQAFLLYFYLLHAIRTQQDLYFLVTIWLIALSMESLILIAIRLVGHNMSFANVTIRIDPDHRVGGTVGSPNGAAAYLELFLAPTLSLLLSHGFSKTRKALALVAFS